MLSILTHLSFAEREAYRHWRRIQAHRDRLKTALGRDVGLRVALLDYFVNVNRELHNPKVIEISIYERTERSAVTDGLTGLFNHAYFLLVLKREVLRARRHDLKLSVAMFDLDDFKKVNDTRGHLEGDRILTKTAAVVKESLREIDTAARYGGEEFAILLPETSGAGAQVVADRIRRRIEDRFRHRDATRVTISGGVATYPEDATSPQDLLRRADEGLYRAKADGKNRITTVVGERRRHLRVPVSHPLLLRAASSARGEGQERLCRRAAREPARAGAGGEHRHPRDPPGGRGVDGAARCGGTRREGGPRRPTAVRGRRPAHRGVHPGPHRAAPRGLGPGLTIPV
jgi:diguanylate cyclase (GGDEF)-like protein